LLISIDLLSKDNTVLSFIYFSTTVLAVAFNYHQVETQVHNRKRIL